MKIYALRAGLNYEGSEGLYLFEHLDGAVKYGREKLGVQCFHPDAPDYVGTPSRDSGYDWARIEEHDVKIR